MKALAIAVVLAVLAISAVNAEQVVAPSTIAPSTQTPSTAPPVETPIAKPTPGPVLVDGKSTYVLVFDNGKNSKVIESSQVYAPPNVYFVATPGTLCVGAVNVTTVGTVIPGGPVTSKGPFTITRIGAPAGCAISITSSAGGPPATVVFQ
jgi:hypothetical protein